MVKPNASNFNASEVPGTQLAQTSSSETSGANGPDSLDVWSDSEESLLPDDDGLEEAHLPDTSQQIEEEVRRDSPSNKGTSVEPSSQNETGCPPEDILMRYAVEQVSQITNEELLGLKEELARLRKSKLWNTYLRACPNIMYVMHELVRDYPED